MDYRVLEKTEDQCFIEVIKDTYRTRIEFDYTPSEDFKGIAVCCSYSFKGNPVGYLKDNGLVRNGISGYRQRPLFELGDTIIQAGPSLIKEGEPFKDYLSEGFDQRAILSGFHAHIGRKESGNIVVGFSKKLTFVSMVNKYAELFTTEAIKLPGHKKGAFYFKSKYRIVKEGVYPTPAALIIEPKLNKVGDLFREIT